jgi:hypothetical protein
VTSNDPGLGYCKVIRAVENQVEGKTSRADPIIRILATKRDLLTRWLRSEPFVTHFPSCAVPGSGGNLPHLAPNLQFRWLYWNTTITRRHLYAGKSVDLDDTLRAGFLTIVREKIMGDAVKISIRPLTRRGRRDILDLISNK